MDIFLVILVLFCYFLHKMCSEKGISPWGYLTGFITGFFLVLVATSIAIIFFYGQNIVNDPDVQKKLVIFAPFTLISQFLLFYFFRRRISRIPDYEEEDDDTIPPPSSNGKKDLSYFR